MEASQDRFRNMAPRPSDTLERRKARRRKRGLEDDLKMLRFFARQRVNGARAADQCVSKFQSALQVFNFPFL